MLNVTLTFIQMKYILHSCQRKNSKVCGNKVFFYANRVRMKLVRYLIFKGLFANFNPQLNSFLVHVSCGLISTNLNITQV